MQDSPSVSSSAGGELWLFDAYAFVFRAFFAMPPLTSPQGEPAGAVYGFVKMITQLLKGGKAEGGGHRLAAAVFDHGSPSFRHALYSEYKAHRPDVPEDLRSQFPLIRTACAAMGLPALEQEGMEADDIIASLAKRAERAGMNVIIVSSDKDLMQLVSERVTLLDPVKQKRMAPADVLEKIGVHPHQVRDYLALTGDTADNVPGVKGIGPKTAAALLAQFGDLETLLAGVQQVSRVATRTMLTDHAETARLSQQLVSLREDAAPEADPESLIYHGPDPEAFRAFAERYGFKSLLKAAPKRSASASPVSTVSAEARVWKREEARVLTPAGFTAALAALATGERGAGLSCIPSACVGGGASEEEEEGREPSLFGGAAPATKAGAVWQFGLDDGRDVSETSCAASGPEAAALARALAALLADEQVLLYVAELKPLLRFIYEAAPETEAALNLALCDDIGVMAYAAGQEDADDPAAVILRTAGFMLSDPEEALKEGSAKEKKNAAAAVAALPGRAAGLARGALLAGPSLREAIGQAKTVRVYYEIDRPLTAVLARMERAGVFVDSARLHALTEEYHGKMAALTQRIYEAAGGPFNISSPKQLGEVLFDRLGLQTGRKTGKTKAYSTDAETLEALHAGGAEVAGHVLEYRRYAKLVGTYTETLPKLLDEHSRVHTTFAPTHTSTGRLSSLHPNLQNIPIRREEGGAVRSAFRAAPGYVLISADYSQIELRLLAALAEIPALKAAFAAGTDIHAATAAELFGGVPEAVTPEQRRTAKTVNFGVIYGVSAFGLAARLGIGREEAKMIIERYFIRYPEIRRYMDETVEYARRHGHVRTWFGRKCLTPQIQSSNGAMRQFAERAAVNAPLQGTAADIIRMAMRDCEAYCRKQLPLSEGGKGRIRQVLQVHDELLFEAEEGGASAHKEALARVMQETTRGAGLSVPMVAQVGQGLNWQAAH